MVTRDIFDINEVNLELIKPALNDIFYMLDTVVSKTRVDFVLSEIHNLEWETEMQWKS